MLVKELQFSQLPFMRSKVFLRQLVRGSTLVSLPPQERRGSRRFVISARDQWLPVWICFVCDEYFSRGGDGGTREGKHDVCCGHLITLRKAGWMDGG